jgi:predicted house-cleaning noncanonical NTP pyrophosphatase (MazG superfamily)
MKTYNKLVRDKIPAVIAAEGKKAKTSELSDKEYLKELIKKLAEEVEEFKKEPSIEELADIKEVTIAIREAMKIHAGELEDMRRKKASERGRFKKGYYIHELTLPADNKWAKYYAADPKRFPEHVKD